MTLNLQNFPEWFSKDGSNINQEVFLHIKAKEGEVPIARRNRFLIAKYLKEKTNQITKASYNAEGDMILKVKGEKEAEKILQMNTIGTWPVTIERHRTLNSSKGVIFSPDMCWLEEEEIKEGLSDYKVTEVFIFKRTPRNGEQGGNSEPKPYGLAILTFNTQEPPKRIKYGFEYIEVRHYIPNPKRCRKCQRLGHTTKWCKSTTETCAECGQENQQNHSCGMKMCVNCCKPGHASNSRDCPTYLMHKEWEAIMVLQKKTKYEAKQIFFAKYKSLEGFMATKNKSMAQIVGNQNVSQSQDTMNRDNAITSDKPDNISTENSNTSNKKGTSDKSVNISTDSSSTSNKKGTGDKQPLAANITEKKEKQSNEITVSRVVNSARKPSYIKLKYWKQSTKGITFTLGNYINGEEVPKVDFSKFKGHKTVKTEKILKYAREVLSNEDVLKTVVREVAKNKKCNRIIVEVGKDKISVTALDEDDESGSDGQTSVEMASVTAHAEEDESLDGQESEEEGQMSVDEA